MSIDFASLVLGPCMDTFADPIVFTPAVSQPGAAPYLARGVYSVKQITIRQDEGDFTDQQPTLGIKLADFLVPPKQNDSFVLTGVSWFVWDCLPDGQGGADLIIKQTPVLS